MFYLLSYHTDGERQLQTCPREKVQEKLQSAPAFKRRLWLWVPTRQRHFLGDPSEHKVMFQAKLSPCCFLLAGCKWLPIKLISCRQPPFTIQPDINPVPSYLISLTHGEGRLTQGSGFQNLFWASELCRKHTKTAWQAFCVCSRINVCKVCVYSSKPNSSRVCSQTLPLKCLCCTTASGCWFWPRMVISLPNIGLGHGSEVSMVMDHFQ